MRRRGARSESCCRRGERVMLSLALAGSRAAGGRETDGAAISCRAHVGARPNCCCSPSPNFVCPVLVRHCLPPGRQKLHIRTGDAKVKSLGRIFWICSTWYCKDSA